MTSLTPSSLRIDKKCGKSGIADNKKCTKQTTPQTPGNEEKSGGGGPSTALLLSAGGVVATGVVLGVIAKDIYGSGVPKEKVPPKVPPPGLYDTFKPGDLIYQTDEFAGANRAHYAVYVGKVDGEHRVFDTSAQTIKGKQTSKMQLRTIKEATGTGTSFALASRVDEKRRRPTSQELEKIIKRLNGKSFDWTGFEDNCETLARSIVNDLPVSTQSKNVSGMTNFLAKTMISAMAPKGYRKRAVKQKNINNLVARTLGDSMSITPSSLKIRADKKCGNSGIPENAKCHKGGGGSFNAGLLATGLVAGGITAYALTRGGGKATSASTESPTKPRPSLPGVTPKALLAPAPPRKSKTQRMRENTQTAMREAEGAIAQTAREEVRRVGQIGNTMAKAGEATGMAAKTTFRELRLRTEAARRRYEPGYRRPDQRRLPGGVGSGLPRQERTRSLEELGQMSTEELRTWMTDPRTGQPRRRKPQGFGRRDNYIQYYAPTQLQPPTRRDAEDGKKYTKTVTNPETGRKNKVRYGAKGYKIAPGTNKGDRYCARSFGDMKSEGYDCSGAERNTPLCLSRAKWKCSGKTSRRDGLTPGKSSA
jgi:hypothetical protein